MSEVFALELTHLLRECCPFGDHDIHQQAGVAHHDGAGGSLMAACHHSHCHSILLDRGDVICLVILIPASVQGLSR